jgi:hypothetical protein
MFPDQDQCAMTVRIEIWVTAAVAWLLLWPVVHADGSDPSPGKFPRELQQSGVLTGRDSSEPAHFFAGPIRLLNRAAQPPAPIPVVSTIIPPAPAVQPAAQTVETPAGPQLPSVIRATQENEHLSARAHFFSEVKLASHAERSRSGSTAFDKAVALEDLANLRPRDGQPQAELRPAAVMSAVSPIRPGSKPTSPVAAIPQRVERAFPLAQFAAPSIEAVAQTEQSNEVRGPTNTEVPAKLASATMPITAAPAQLPMPTAEVLPMPSLVRQPGDTAHHLVSLSPRLFSFTSPAESGILSTNSGLELSSFAADPPQLTSLETTFDSVLRPTEVMAAASAPEMAIVEDQLVSLPLRTGPIGARLQPIEVLAAPQSQANLGEMLLAELPQRFPAPAVTLNSAGVVSVHEPQEVATQFRMASLRQPAALQPAEVLPIPTPQSPTAPRVPALDGDRPIGALTTNVLPTNGRLPQDVAAARFRGDYPAFFSRNWEDQVYFWDAPNLCYGALRYEEVNLERYGYSCCPIAQPAISGLHFLGSTLALPYTLTAHHPSECIYPLGHYRPGSPAPFRKIWPDFKPLAASAEVATIAGLILLIP